MTKNVQAVTRANIADMKRLYTRAQKAYYNSEPIMSDAEFDKMEDGIRKIDPDWSKLHKTGVKVGKKVEVEHEYFMPSLNKAYPEDYPKWLAKNKADEYIAMAKLDGSSLAPTYDKGVPVRLVTRGDGERGKDVSYLIPALVKHHVLPKKIGTKKRTTFRCEAIMKDRIFENRWSRAAKGANGFDNARNMVNGLFNRQDAHPALADIDLVVLGVFGHGIQAGLELAEAWGFVVVPHAVMARSVIGTLTMDKVHSMFKGYKFDGAVVADSDFFYEYENSDKPKKGIIAYKENDEEGAAEVIVEEIIWQKSRTGRWTPKIVIEPTEMDGVMVKHATAHNAKWMNDRGIGVGAVVKVLRSGGVIPKIVGVVKKARKLSEPEGETIWEGVHLYAVETSAAEYVQKNLFFLQTMGIENVAEKGVEKLHDLGLRDFSDFIKMVKMTKVPKILIEGLGKANAAKVHAQIIEKLSKPKLKTLMVAAQVFGIGIGERKLTQLEEGGFNLQDLLNSTGARHARSNMMCIKGFQEKTIDKIISGIPHLNNWLVRIGSYIEIDFSTTKKKVVKGGQLSGVNVTWTGYRSPDQEALVESLGGSVVSFSSKTTVLLYKEGGKSSTKVAKAGERAMTWAEFTKAYKVKA